MVAKDIGEFFAPPPDMPDLAPSDKVVLFDPNGTLAVNHGVHWAFRNGIKLLPQRQRDGPRGWVKPCGRFQRDSRIPILVRRGGIYSGPNEAPIIYNNRPFGSAIVVLRYQLSYHPGQGERVHHGRSREASRVTLVGGFVVGGVVDISLTSG
jgi:hypothetical protein